MTVQEYKDTLTNNINYYLQLNGTHQNDIVNALHVAPMTVNRWFSGERCPTIDQIGALAEYFNVPIEKLILPHQKEDHSNQNLSYPLYQDFYQTLFPHEKVKMNQSKINTADCLINRYLPDRMKSVVRSAFGLDMNGKLNLSAIARQNHISRERVRQIYNEALEILRLYKPEFMTKPKTIHQARDINWTRTVPIGAVRRILSSRTYCALSKCPKIETLYDLIHMPTDEIQNIRGIGSTAIREINNLKETIVLQRRTGRGA